jgi:iron(III) transport system permease protein
MTKTISVRARVFNWCQSRIGLQPRKILLIAVTVITVFLVLPPMAILLFSSVRSTESTLPFEVTNYTLSNYVKVFSAHSTYQLLLNTVWYTLGTVGICLVLTTAFAWFLERTNVPFRRILFMLLLAPMGMPGVVTGMAWILLANPANGLLNVLIRTIFGMEGPGPINIYSMSGMIWVTSLRFVPMMYIMISGVFSRIDPAYEEAAWTSGSKPWTTFMHISRPMLTPALLGAVIYYVVLTMEMFEIAGMLGMPKGIYVFSTAVYYAVHRTMGGGGLPNYGLASAYGSVLLAAATALIYFYSRQVRHGERYVTVTGRGYRPRLFDLGRWKFVPVLAMCFYFVFAVAMPLLILIWTSLAPRIASPSLSNLSLLNFGAYRELLKFKMLWSAAANTLVIATTVGLATMLLATVISWLSVRSGMRGVWAIPEKLSFLILGVPGVVLSLSLIFVYASLPIPIYGTIWIIVVAEVTRGLTYGTRLMTAAYLQIHKELEEASSTSGAHMGTSFFHIVLPLLRPSFARGFLWLFAFSIRNTTIPLMLYAAGNETIAVTLWYLWVEEAEFSLASAIAVPLVLITSALSFFIARKTMLAEGGT